MSEANQGDIVVLQGVDPSISIIGTVEFLYSDVVSISKPFSIVMAQNGVMLIPISPMAKNPLYSTSRENLSAVYTDIDYAFEQEYRRVSSTIMTVKPSLITG